MKGVPILCPPQGKDLSWAPNQPIMQFRDFDFDKARYENYLKWIMKVPLTEFQKQLKETNEQ